MNLKTDILSYLVVFLFVSCSSEPEIGAADKRVDGSTNSLPPEIAHYDNLTVLHDSIASNTIQFKKESVFKHSDEPSSGTDIIYIGNMSNMAVDDKGRVYVAPGGLGAEQTIPVFNADGSYYRNIGRKGRGPGEFVQVANIEVHSEKLYVYDQVLFRYSIFSLDDFEPLSQITLRPGSFQDKKGLEQHRAGTNFFPRSDGSILVEFKEPPRLENILLNKKEDSDQDIKRYDRYFLINESGSVFSNQIFEQEDLIFGDSPLIPFEEGKLPHSRNPVMAVGNDGKIYSAWTGEFLIKVHNAKGEYERAIFYPFEKAVLNRDDIISNYDDRPRVKTIAENADYPDTWPAIDQILVDDENRLWVSTITDSNTTFEWWVIDEEGELLAKFNWPGARLERGGFKESILQIKGGHLYAYDSVENSYVGDIVKYRIEFEEQ